MAIIYGRYEADTLTGSDQADTIYGYPEAATPPSKVIASGLYRPLFATAPKGDNKSLYVVSQGGKITVHDLTDPQAVPKDFIVIPDDKIDNNDEAGLLGFTFHPQFATNGKCYVNYTEEGSREQVIVEYTVDLTSTSSPPAHTTRKIMMIDYPDTTSHHRAGWIDFGPDGMLYIATGDGWRKENSQESNADSAQTLVNSDGSINHLGKILRINVNGDGFPEDADRNYSIPDGSGGISANPTAFQGVTGRLQEPSEIWAIGLRNPWRASFGPDGKLYVADVGQHHFEEVNVVEAGRNYGWRNASIADGPQAEPEGVDNYTDPYHHYDRDVGRSVTGGYFYSGEGSLKGKYIFGDFVLGKIFAMDVSGPEGQVQDVTHLFKDVQGNQINFGSLSSFGLDGLGNLYAIDYGDGMTQSGRIFRLSDNTPVEDGNDDLTGGAGNDTIYGGGGDDTLYGSADGDHLYGDEGNDQLHGGDDAGIDEGTDTLTGGAGDDIYYVSSGDTVVELAGTVQSNDEVRAIESFTLEGGQAVEVLQAWPADSEVALDLTGNGLSQRLIGNAGANILDGNGGPDTLEGRAGNDTYVVDGMDTIVETNDDGSDAGGIDTVQTALNNYTLGTNLENLTLLGTAAINGSGNGLNNIITGNNAANSLSGADGVDTLIGGGGNDTLNGGDISDRLEGGADDDTYRIYGQETIEEAAGMGIDTIIVAAADYTLGAGIHVEILKANPDSVGGNLTGNELSNTLYGNRGRNSLDGGAGEDTVVLSGKRADYSIVRNGDGSFTVTDTRADGDRIDTITRVEIFKFDDITSTADRLLLSNFDLTGDVVEENKPTGFEFGQFSVKDAVGTLHFELLNNAEGRFAIDQKSGKIRVEDGVRLDYEQAKSHLIEVQVTDATGASMKKTFTIQVGNSLNETAAGGALGDVLMGGEGQDFFKGAGGNDRLSADLGNDRLYGEAGNDTLEGGSGNDLVDGGLNNDRLIGGLGKDTFTGGRGRDVFVFDDRETSASKSKADTITDFKGREGDRIDLRAVDANTKKSGDQNFSFIGTKAFTKAGEVRYEKTKSYTYVHLNTDSDKAAEAVIKLKGSIDLTKGWFVL